MVVYSNHRRKVLKLWVREGSFSEHKESSSQYHKLRKVFLKKKTAGEETTSV